MVVAEKCSDSRSSVVAMRATTLASKSIKGTSPTCDLGSAPCPPFSVLPFSALASGPYGAGPVEAPAVQSTEHPSSARGRPLSRDRMDCPDNLVSPSQEPIDPSDRFTDGFGDLALGRLEIFLCKASASAAREGIGPRHRLHSWHG